MGQHYAPSIVSPTTGMAYFPREVFFFGLGLPGDSLPAAAARFFCFFVATSLLRVLRSAEQ